MDFYHVIPYSGESSRVATKVKEQRTRIAFSSLSKAESRYYSRFSNSIKSQDHGFFRVPGNPHLNIPRNRTIPPRTAVATASFQASPIECHSGYQSRTHAWFQLEHYLPG